MTGPRNIREGRLELHAGRILVVDDNPVNITLIEKILVQDGYRHVESTTHPKAVRRLYAANAYDLILLDIHMPEMNGFEVMTELQADNPDDYLPILVLTADRSPQTRHLCLASGAKDFINKPFERIEVLFRVRNILEVRMLHQAVLKQNEELEEKVRQRTRQLYEAQTKIIQCLGKAAEYRDNETGMHVIRMSKACALLAKRMGFNDTECDMILQASPMHDIGKIAIPDEVLLKPGRLNDREWLKMKTHSEVGAEILGSYDTELMTVAARIAKTHHERWDGSGYPLGLKGEEIPLYTRIVSVCDVFDALTSKRPYKPAWSPEKAMDYLRQNAGSHFDPTVVDHFAAILDQILALKRNYPDLPHSPTPEASAHGPH